MKKILIVSALAASLSACANFPGMAPPPASAPDTPVFFQTGLYKLDAPALSAVDSAAKAAAAAPDAPVYVTGAADPVGSNAENATLSQARAKAVATALEADGVAAGRIHIRALGEVQAPSPGTQFSRRALIHIGA